MARVCVSCKKRIPDNESAWRDHKKVYACIRCYKPAVSVARAVNDERE